MIIRKNLKFLILPIVCFLPFILSIIYPLSDTLFWVAAVIPTILVKIFFEIRFAIKADALDTTLDKVVLRDHYLKKASIAHLTINTVLSGLYFFTHSNMYFVPFTLSIVVGIFDLFNNFGIPTRYGRNLPEIEKEDEEMSKEFYDSFKTLKKNNPVK